jgi:hypothetical protein
VFRTYIETIETNRNVPQRTETTQNFIKIPKYALYQTVSVGLLFVLVQLKHRNSLFWYRSETNQTNYLETKQTEKVGKTLNFLKKYQNMHHIKLVRLDSIKTSKISVSA